MGDVTGGVVERLLARRGYRVTSTRRRLLSAMLDLDDYFFPDALVTATPTVGRSTVFRTLRLFQEIGVVCQIVLADGSLAYRLAPAHHHHHVHCVECGMVEDFSSGSLEAVFDGIETSTGYHVIGHRLEVYGRCPRCRAAEDSDSPPGGGGERFGDALNDEFAFDVRTSGAVR